MPPIVATVRRKLFRGSTSFYNDGDNRTGQPVAKVGPTVCFNWVGPGGVALKINLKIYDFM